MIQKFFKNIVEGIGNSSSNRRNHAQLIKEFREAFQKEPLAIGTKTLLLTMGVPNKINVIENGYDIPTLNTYLDWFNVFTFDYHTSEEPEVHLPAPLYAFGEQTGREAKLNIVKIHFNLCPIIFHRFIFLEFNYIFLFKCWCRTIEIGGWYP